MDVLIEVVQRLNHLRVTFAPEDEVLERGIKLLGEVLVDFFMQ